MAALFGEMIFNTGVIHQAPDPIQWFHYTNQDTFIKHFKQFSIMLGMELGGIADFACNIVSYAGGQENWICSHGWDHYADPTDTGVYTYSFGNDYYVVRPGGSLDMAVLLSPASVGGSDPNPGAIVQVVGRWVRA